MLCITSEFNPSQVKSVSQSVSRVEVDTGLPGKGRIVLFNSIRLDSIELDQDNRAKEKKKTTVNKKNEEK